VSQPHFALLLFIQELAFQGFFTVALTEISGKNHIGSHITTTSIKKRITVAFNNCYAEKPIKVQVVVTGSPILPDTFRTLLVDTFPWGFVFDVVRADNLTGWSQSDVYANWTALFSKYISNLLF